MRVVEYVQMMNKQKNPIRRERWIDLKQYYMSMYRHYMLIMYDKGYISDPTRGCTDELVGNILDFGVYDFKDRNGFSVLSSELADFARRKYNDDEEKKEFFDLLYNVLKYSEYCIELDKQFELNSSDCKVQVTVRGGGVLVTSLNSIEYNKGVLTLLVKDGYLLREKSINLEIFCKAVDELSIEPCDGCLVKGLSVDDTVKCLRVILEGMVTLDGKYGRVLEKWLDKNYDNEEGMYYFLCKKHTEELISCIEESINSCGEDFVALYMDKIYYKDKIQKYRIPCGMFSCITYGDEEDFIESAWSALYGYTGEAYTAERLDSQYDNYIGIPIILNINGREIEAYDYSQVINMVEQDSWFKVENMDFTFEEGFVINNPYELGTIERELVEAYEKGMNGCIHEISSEFGTLKEIKQARKKMLPKFVKLIEENVE